VVDVLARESAVMSPEVLVAQLSRDQLPYEMLHAQQQASFYRELVERIEQRITTEQVLTIGEVWSDRYGRDHCWTTERTREVIDADMLRDALYALPDSRTSLVGIALREAFKPQPPKVYLEHLDRAAKFSREVKQTVRAFTRWKDSRPRFRALDAER